MSDIQNSERSLQGQTIIVERQSNGVGTAGFVLAVVTFFLGWIPVLGWILWLLGLILSSIGMSKQPRGLAIAGFIISLISLVFLIFVMGIIAAFIGL